jgi:phosphatidylserine/phosphatidylglycerophosphate/cardiolipin synthase-like enzyme
MSLAAIVALSLLTGCASNRVSVDCEGCQADGAVDRLYESRTWVPPSQHGKDPIAIATGADIPIHATRGKIIGPDYDDSVTSLALKIWLIENARYTVDAIYYIFKRDLAGYAILGALCDAVQRGVDVRIMVDSIGSLHPTHDELRALETCAETAGQILTAEGYPSTRKARVQVVIYNALSKVFTRFNRRSHDKLLVVDGRFPERAVVMTGGRNVSTAYYGIDEDGSPDPTAYRDVEIVLRPAEVQPPGNTVGDASEIYYTIIWAYQDNRRLRPVRGSMDLYHRQRDKSQQSLEFLKQLDTFRTHYANMPQFMNTGFREAEARIAHELGNMVTTNVVADFQQNLAQNPNSITAIFQWLGENDKSTKTIRLVSPYLILPQYKNEQGDLALDGKANLERWLNQDPERRVEIVTNSVMTSDNFFTQAIIDLDTAPLMLLDAERVSQWQGSLDEGELNPALVESAEWRALINNPRVAIYQTGRLDALMFGHGEQVYGKLHAKFAISDDLIFVGTTNMDHRSRLYNNEFGFFVRSTDLRQDLIEVFDALKRTSYRWGSPEWLEMRKQLRALDTAKARWARRQHSVFARLRGTGL